VFASITAMLLLGSPMLSIACSVFLSSVLQCVYGIVYLRQSGFTALYYRVYDAVSMFFYFRTSKKMGLSLGTFSAQAPKTGLCGASVYQSVEFA
jgi:hypothetical protein